MRKMFLLAAMVAIAALMMAATPAFAQKNAPRTEIDGFVFVPGACANLEGTTLSQAEAVALLEAAGLDPDELPDRGNVCLLAEPDGNGNGDGDGDDNGDRDGDRDRRDNRDNRDNVVVPVFEITQDFEQECESGDVDQSFDVSQTGDNSNQTVGIQGVANTGCAQTQLGVVDAGGFANINNDEDVFVDFNNDEDEFCDEFDEFCEDLEDLCDDSNGDGFCEDLEDFCEDFNRDGLCDILFDGDDADDELFIFGDDDDFNIFGNNDGGDLEFEDVGSTIEVSPTNTTSSDQQVNQAATAFGGK